MALPPPKPGLRAVGKPGAKPGGKGQGYLLDARAQEEAERQDRHRSEALADTCGEVEDDLEVLRARYELYFLGIERREPSREREEMRRRVARLKTEFTRNTGLRFRIETLHARFLAYDRLWLRSAREREEGTYRRDLVRARRKSEKHGKQAAAPGAQAESAPAAGAPPAEAKPAEGPATAVPPPPLAAVKEQAPAAAPAPPPAAQAAPSPPPRPAQAPAAGPTQRELRALFDAYVEAKRRCNEDVSRISYDALARTVSRQIPELMAKYKASAVEFKVVIKDGRAVLKAVPRV